MTKKDNKKEQRMSNGTTRQAVHRPAGAKWVVWLAVAVLVVAVAVLVVLARGGVSSKRLTPEQVIARDGKDFGVVYPKTIADVMGGQDFTQYSVTTGDKSVGWLMVSHVPAGTSEARSATVAVRLDDNMNISWVSVLSGGSAETDLVRASDKWLGVKYMDAWRASDAMLFGTDSAVTRDLRTTVQHSIASLYAFIYGDDAYHGMAILVGAEGFKNGEALPSFAAVTIDGIPVSNGTLRGQKAVLIATSPVCGSCYDATIAILKELSAMNVKDTQAVVLVMAPADNPRSIALEAAVPPGVLLVQDADEHVTRSLFMQNSPYVVLLERDGTVLFHGKGYDLASVTAALKELAALP